MSQLKNLMGSGIAGQAAQAINGTVTLNQTASGASQGAQALPSDFVVYSASTALTGPTLPAMSSPGDAIMIANNTANTINIWPPVGGKIQNGTVNAADTILSGRSAYYIALGNGDWIHMQGAAA